LQRILFLILTLFLLAPLQAAGGYRVVGYYPSWMTARLPPEDIPYDKLTHICHAFAYPEPDGSIRHDDNLINPALIDHAHRHGVKVLISLGGWGWDEQFRTMNSNPAARERFADLDWEYPRKEDAERFIDLVSRLRKSFNAEGIPLLTAAVPSKDFRDGYPKELIPLFDWVGVMTYDFHGSWTDHAGHNAPLAAPEDHNDGSVMDSMAYWIGEKGWPRERTLSGIPFYGRRFVTAGLNKPATGGDSVLYDQAEEMRAEGWNFHWDPVAMVPYLQNPDETELVTYENPKSVAAKAAAGKQGSGVIIWALGHDYVDGETPLLNAVAQVLLSDGDSSDTMKKTHQSKPAHH
jgi:chitinase